jgi:hypothetical protein
MAKQEQGTITAKDVAIRVGLSTDGKRMRSFMRSVSRNGVKGVATPVGQGNRYGMTKAQADAIVKLYLASHPKAQDKDARKRTPKAVKADVAPSHASEAEAVQDDGANGTQDAS